MNARKPPMWDIEFYNPGIEVDMGQVRWCMKYSDVMGVYVNDSYEQILADARVSVRSKKRLTELGELLINLTLARRAGGVQDS